MFSLIPWWGRWAAIAGLVAASCIFTGIRVHRHDQEALDAFKLSVSEASAKQALQTKQIVAQQSAISAQKDTQYAQNLANLRAFYAQRMRNAAGSGSLPQVPNAPSSLDEVPADALPLAGQCAETTQQLEDLQDWVRQEETVE